MRKAIYLSLIAAILFSASCKKKDPTPTPTPTPTPAAKVMFTHACLDANAQGVQINDVAISSLSLNFLASSAYTNITPGTAVKTAFVYASTSAPLLVTSPTYNFADGSHYSVFALGRANSPAMIETVDDLTAPSSGMSKARVINLCADTTISFNFDVNGIGKVDSGIAFKTVTPFREIPAGDKQVIIEDPTDVFGNVTINSQHFVAGKIYTIMITGSKTLTGVDVRTATVIANN